MQSAFTSDLYGRWISVLTRGPVYAYYPMERIKPDSDPIRREREREGQKHSSEQGDWIEYHRWIIEEMNRLNYSVERLEKSMARCREEVTAINLKMTKRLSYLGGAVAALGFATSQAAHWLAKALGGH